MLALGGIEPEMGFGVVYKFTDGRILPGELISCHIYPCPNPYTPAHRERHRGLFTRATR